MKKYLIMVSAIAISGVFVGCHEDEFSGSLIEQKKMAFEEAFVRAFGQPDPNHNWGFKTSGGDARAITRSGNTGDTYPSTEAYHNMNHNEWADPDKEFGGYTVPDRVTDKQRAVVAAYFQTVSPLSYEDPHLRHFFVQQVYKGGNTTVHNTTEGIIAADNSAYTSDNMNLLSVGQNNIHINDFNGGTCSESDVLNNGQHVDGTTHKDQITLMVNIDDTSCFGYHETGSSTQHNNKAALVGWKTIDIWAKDNYPGYDGCLDDNWDRSYLGFDLAIKEGAQAYDTNEDGTVNYADYSQAPTSPTYGWDGEKIVEMGTYSTYQPDPNNPYWIETRFDGYKDEYKNIMKGTEAIGWLTTNENFYVAEDKITLTGEYSNGEIPQSRLNDEDLQNVLVFKDVQIPGAQNNKGHVINLKRIKELVDDGYLPINNKSLTEWVKVGTSDGYYSDWIVTLTKAERNIHVNPSAPDVKTITGEPGKRYTKTGWTIVESGRVMCEDLATSDLDDMDFNDVVYDAIIFKEYKYLCTENGTRLFDDNFTDGYETTYANVRLMAAGGTIPVEMVVGNNNYDVHEELGAPDNVMINTLPNTEKDRQDVKMATVFESAAAKTLTDKNTGSEKLYGISSISDIELNVLYNKVSTKLTSKDIYGAATYMFCVDLGLPWARERKNFADPYPSFPAWVQNSKNTQWYKDHRTASLYTNNNLVGLTEPTIPAPTIEFYDNNGAGSTLEKSRVSADPGTMAYPASTETILFDFDADGSAPGFLCPAVTTKDGTSYDEEKVVITGTSNITTGNKVRIYGVYINGWSINTNFSGMINSGAEEGYIEIPITDSNVANVQSGITITGQNFTVTYVTVY